MFVALRQPASVTRLLCALTLAAIPVVLAVLFASSPAGRSTPLRVWYTPAPGSLDMLRLFEAPEEWSEARSRVSVFKFYQGQLLEPAPDIFGPNTYQALCSVGAFRILSQVWHKRVAIEVGAVKEFYCTPDPSGMNRSIRDTLSAIRAVHAAGGEVSYLALDEPFLSGSLAACGGPDPNPTVQRLERYFANVRFAAPRVAIGLIEPYPSFSVAQLLDFVRRMAARGIRPAFFHLDADLNQLPDGSDTFPQDLQALAEGLAREHVPLGVIFWGHSGDSDALYYRETLTLIRRTNSVLLPDLAQDAVFQSWAESRTGLRITPTNLPEWGANTHTALIVEGLQLLRRPPAESR